MAFNIVKSFFFVTSLFLLVTKICVDGFSLTPEPISSKFCKVNNIHGKTGCFDLRKDTIQIEAKSTPNIFSQPLGMIVLDEDVSVAETSKLKLTKWMNENKKQLALSSLIVSAAVLGNPSISSASAGIVDAINVGGIGPMATTATTFMERLSGTGFYQAFSLVFVSEIGDKTFFIAGLLAMKTGRLLSFVGSIGALAAMTILSVLIGQIFHAVPSGFTQGIPLDDIAAVVAFTFFGLKTLKEASEVEEDNSGIDEEFADAEEAVEESDTIKQVTTWGKIASTFGLVFAAEFGDRSFLSTIALSAAQNPVSVAVGAIVAHAIATGIAVAGGSYVAKYISEKAIGYIGGSLFLIFAVTTAFGIF